jgi:hypothetical protein
MVAFPMICAIFPCPTNQNNADPPSRRGMISGALMRRRAKTQRRPRFRRLRNGTEVVRTEISKLRHRDDPLSCADSGSTVCCFYACHPGRGNGSARSQNQFTLACPHNSARPHSSAQKSFVLVRKNAFFGQLRVLLPQSFSPFIYAGEMHYHEKTRNAFFWVQLPPRAPLHPLRYPECPGGESLVWPTS